MKIVFKKENMEEALNIVTKALPSSKQSNILDNIIIEANNNIFLTATDQEITIKTPVLGKIEEPGSIAIDGRFFENLIKNLNAEEKIELTSTDKYEVIFKYNIKGNNQTTQAYSTESFPRSIKINKENKIKISEFILKKMLKKTVFAVDRNLKEERKILTGVFFSVNEDKFILKAIDEEKIAITNQILNEKYKKTETIVPASTIDKLIKILKGDIEKEVNIYINEKNITFETGQTTIISNIIEGNYVNTDKIINTEYTTKVKIDKNKFYDSIKRAANYTDEIIKKPVITEVKENNIEIRLDSLKGSIKENIDIEKTGNDLAIAFNINTLLSILSAIEEETVCLYMTTPMHPIFIKDEKETYFYFMIPISF